MKDTRFTNQSDDIITAREERETERQRKWNVLRGNGYQESNLEDGLWPSTWEHLDMCVFLSKKRINFKFPWCRF